MMRDPLFSTLFPLLLAGLFGVVPALAQVTDPTRPPGALMAPESSGGAVAPVAGGVQTVIVRPKGKSAAVINGQYVEVGGKLGDKKVVRISESEVVLQGEGGRDVMKVMPDIEKLPIRKTAEAKQRTMGTTGK